MRYLARLLAPCLSLFVVACAGQEEGDCASHANGKELSQALAAYAFSADDAFALCQARPFSGLDQTVLSQGANYNCHGICREEFIDFHVGVFGLAYLEDQICKQPGAEFVTKALFPVFLETLAEHSPQAAALESCLAENVISPGRRTRG
jgi:hypothetical protein